MMQSIGKKEKKKRHSRKMMQSIGEKREKETPQSKKMPTPKKPKSHAAIEKHRKTKKIQATKKNVNKKLEILNYNRTFIKHK